MLHSVTDFFYSAKNLIYEEIEKFMIDRIKDLSINDFIEEIDKVNINDHDELKALIISWLSRINLTTPMLLKSEPHYGYFLMFEDGDIYLKNLDKYKRGDEINMQQLYYEVKDAIAISFNKG